MIWLALAVVVYAVLQLCLLALCRAAAWADDQTERNRHEYMLTPETFGHATADVETPGARVVGC